MKSCIFCRSQNLASDLFCHACKKILPYFDTDAFALLGLPCDYNVSQELLDKNYFHLLKQVHPDKFIRGTKQEQELAQQYAAALTQAYEILRSNYLRAEEILKIYEKNFVPVLRNDFLLETMQWREQLAEVQSVKEAVALQKDVMLQLEGYWRKIANLFKDKDLESAAYLLAEIKFTQRFLAEIRDKIEQL
jgi:Fe-S protein assembly co-chaperone HscB